MPNLRLGRADAGGTRHRNPVSLQTVVLLPIGKASTMATRDESLALNLLRQVGEYIDAWNRRAAAVPERALEQGRPASESRTVLTSRRRSLNCSLGRNISARTHVVVFRTGRRRESAATLRRTAERALTDAWHGRKPDQRSRRSVLCVAPDPQVKIRLSFAGQETTGSTPAPATESGNAVVEAQCESDRPLPEPTRSLDGCRIAKSCATARCLGTP